MPSPLSARSAPSDEFSDSSDELADLAHEFYPRAELCELEAELRRAYELYG